MKLPLQPLIDKAKEDKNILAVFLFGSHARGEAAAGSDVDICLMLASDVFDAKAAFDKRLAYMADFNIDAHIFSRRLYTSASVFLKKVKCFIAATKDYYMSGPAKRSPNFPTTNIFTVII